MNMGTSKHSNGESKVQKDIDAPLDSSQDITDKVPEEVHAELDRIMETREEIHFSVDTDIRLDGEYGSA